MSSLVKLFLGEMKRMVSYKILPISVATSMSNLADLNHPLTVTAVGGFRFGSDELRREFLAPAVALGFIHGVPELDGRALNNPNAWTMLRLVLTALALILPWCIYVWFNARR